MNHFQPSYPLFIASFQCTPPQNLIRGFARIGGIFWRGVPIVRTMVLGGSLFGSHYSGKLPFQLPTGMAHFLLRVYIIDTKSASLNTAGHIKPREPDSGALLTSYAVSLDTPHAHHVVRLGMYKYVTQCAYARSFCWSFIAATELNLSSILFGDIMALIIE